MILLVALWLFLWISELSGASQCNLTHSTIFEFSLNNRRNASGLWITQVKFGALAVQNETEPWDINVKHVKCEGSNQVNTFATIIVPDIDLSTSANEPKGYTLIPDFGYYKLHTKLKTWEEALKTCEDEGTHLLIINSKEEAKVLGRLWDENTDIDNHYAFSGFHQRYKKGEYVTIFNQSLSTVGYMEWGSSEPGGPSDNCGFVFRRLNLLGDIHCDTKLAFFCEKELQ